MAEDTKTEAATKAAPAKAAQPEVKKPVITKQPTHFKHVYLVDINDDGQLFEVAVVKEDPASGSLIYINIALLDNTDKARLKKIVSSVHADKYALWELMSQERLPNGYNALDYFHQMVRIKNAPGYVNTSMGGGLLGVRPESASIAGGFTNPDQASLG